MQITAYAALKAGDDLSRLEFELAELKSSDVLIKVQACGLSYSDLNMIDNDWFCSTYPIVPGHEVVGVVEAVGCDVVTHAVGEKVGLGWHRSFCNKCEFCLSDEPHLCAQAERTIIDGHGGFASHVVGHERAVIKIPEGLSPEFAAPLMSAGVAVFDPLLAFSIKRSAHVAIIGAGGLGHLAIQFYKAWGCTVTVFTQDISQAAALESLGADKVVSSVDDMAVLDCLNSFEFILSTVNKTVEWGSFMACLKPKGRLHFVGLPLEHLELGI
ncbi:MAG: alcohol dehydrogenase catalytic domain-containing protein, partial [Sinobacterium sp.]|nr:alcohol dehydrogenase catalytic domain-containing protein [Sinobacterium sp.]